MIGVMAVGPGHLQQPQVRTRLPRPAEIGCRDGEGPDLSWGWVGDGDRGLGALWGRKSGPDLPRREGAKRYRGAKKKNIYFWLTASLIAR